MKRRATTTMRQRYRVLIAAALLLCFFPTLTFAIPPVPKNDFLLRLKGSALSSLRENNPKLAKYSDAQLTEALLATAGVADAKSLLPSGVLSATTKTGKALSSKEANAILRLLHLGYLDYFEPNYVQEVLTTPNDASFSNLWGMRDAVRASIGAESAWDVTTGSSNIVVGVIDTGVDYNHPDLHNNMWVNPGEIAGNNIDDDGNGVVDDVYGYNAITGSGNPLDDHFHGTHCAGTIGAQGNNGIGVAGVNWTVKIMALKFLSSTGSGNTADAIKAINYAVQEKNHGVNIRVLSNSWGGGGYSQALYDAIAAAEHAGILFVAAAGNSSQNINSTPSYPASYTNDNVLSVAAIDNNGALASFSNYGATAVDLAAPGVNIYSTLPNNKYGYLSGTSMATPHVSGVAALVLASNPSLTLEQLKSKLMVSTTPLASLSGKTVTGGTVFAPNAIGMSPDLPPEFTTDLEDMQISPAHKVTTISLHASDPEGAPVTFSATLPNTKYTQVASNFVKAYRPQYISNYNNLFGMQERWFLSKAPAYKKLPWVLILPGGATYVQTKTCYKLKYQVGDYYYSNPASILAAQQNLNPKISLSIQSSNLKITLGSTKNFEVPIRVSASDGKHVVSQEFRLTVVNSAPRLSSVSNQEARSGSDLVLDLTASDADHDDLYFSAGVTSSSAMSYNFARALHLQSASVAKKYGTSLKRAYLSSYFGDNAKCFNAYGGRYCVLTGTLEAIKVGASRAKSTSYGYIDATYYDHPERLIAKSKQPYRGSAPATTSIYTDGDDAQLHITPNPNYSGSSFNVTVSVTDTVASAKQSFNIVVR